MESRAQQPQSSRWGSASTVSRSLAWPGRRCYFHCTLQTILSHVPAGTISQDLWIPILATACLPASSVYISATASNPCPCGRASRSTAKTTALKLRDISATAFLRNGRLLSSQNGSYSSPASSQANSPGLADRLRLTLCKCSSRLSAWGISW